ncbi:MAG: hypothetical protein KFF73_16960, partial [Cyclobacteriaceae bacterium]|nr:hypothetical protein [Cyclobacteriaceae bacterium]
GKIITTRSMVYKFYLLILIYSGLLLPDCIMAQKVQLSEVILINGSSFKKQADSEVLRSFYAKEVAPIWSARVKGSHLYLLKADRGVEKDQFLLACTFDDVKARNKNLAQGSPFNDKTFSRLGSLPSTPSRFLTDPDKYTDYSLIGRSELGSLPEVEILGIHYIQVSPDMAEIFEKFVREQLHPKVAGLLPDMGLYYYKGVSGENSGSYITIFAISTIEAREKFWPTGGAETAEVKKAFEPLGDLAEKLETYLVKGSFLLPESGGAAAYFESLRWTDFVLVE